MARRRNLTRQPFDPEAHDQQGVADRWFGGDLDLAAGFLEWLPYSTIPDWHDAETVLGKTRTPVTTLAQLRALPPGTIVLAADGDAYQCDRDPDYADEWYCPGYELSIQPPLPATVIHYGKGAAQ